MGTGLEKDGAKTLVRAFQLLDAVAAKAPVPQKLASLALVTGLHKATAHRLLATLVLERFVELSRNGYSIGSRCWALGTAAAKRFDLSHAVQPSLERIAVDTGDVALFSVRVSTSSECIGRVEGSYPVLPTSTKVGTVRPLGCSALSLAILAALPDKEVKYITDATQEERRALPGFLNAEQLSRKVIEIRERGFAFFDGRAAGMAGIAVAVHDNWGSVVGAIGFAAVEERILPERYPEILSMLKREREQIERQFKGVSQNGPGD